MAPPVRPPFGWSRNAQLRSRQNFPAAIRPAEFVSASGVPRRILADGLALDLYGIFSRLQAFYWQRGDVGRSLALCPSINNSGSSSWHRRLFERSRSEHLL